MHFILACSVFALAIFLERAINLRKGKIISAAFIEEVKQRDLLVSKDIRLDLPAGASQQVTGLRIIEEEKFDALPDEAILEWRQRGWLPLVYWHWLSIDNFLRLLKRSIA